MLHRPLVMPKGKVVLALLLMQDAEAEATGEASEHQMMVQAVVVQAISAATLTVSDFMAGMEQIVGPF